MKKCFCGKNAELEYKIPILGLTESGRWVDIHKGVKNRPMMNTWLCAYHSVFAEAGLILSDGHLLFTPQHESIDLESCSDEDLSKLLKENTGLEDFKSYEKVINTILSARKVEKIYLEKTSKEIKDIIEKKSIFGELKDSIKNLFL